MNGSKSPSEQLHQAALFNDHVKCFLQFGTHQGMREEQLVKTLHCPITTQPLLIFNASPTIDFTACQIAALTHDFGSPHQTLLTRNKKLSISLSP